MAAYAVERIGYSGRWVEEARGLSRRLVRLPRLRAALATGTITWSMAQLVARHATPDDDAELAHAATTMTLRAMRDHLDPERRRPDPDDQDQAPPCRTLEISVKLEDAWAFERARIVVEAVTGERSTDTTVEAMLAETLTSILPPPRSPDTPDLTAQLQRAADHSRWRAEGIASSIAARDVLAKGFEPLFEPRPAVAPDRIDAVAPVTPLPDDADARTIDAHIAGIAAELRTRDLLIGRGARVMLEREGWATLGYASFDQFVRERLGLSRAGVQAKMTLAVRCDELPALGEALRDGRVGVVSAQLVGRVAAPATAMA